MIVLDEDVIIIEPSDDRLQAVPQLAFVKPPDCFMIDMPREFKNAGQLPFFRHILEQVSKQSLFLLRSRGVCDSLCFGSYGRSGMNQQMMKTKD